MYYTTIPLVSERPHNRRWDAAKLRELRKRLDSGTMNVDEIDQIAADFMDSEIVDLASDWLGNTVGGVALYVVRFHANSFYLCRLSKNFSRSALLVPGLRCLSVSVPTSL
jgi:hypothetical protein